MGSKLSLAIIGHLRDIYQEKIFNEKEQITTRFRITKTFIKFWNPDIFRMKNFL